MGLRGGTNMQSKQPNIRLTGCIDSHPKLACCRFSRRMTSWWCAGQPIFFKNVY